MEAVDIETLAPLSLEGMRDVTAECDFVRHKRTVRVVHAGQVIGVLRLTCDESYTLLIDDSVLRVMKHG